MVFCCVCIALHGIFFTSMVFQGIFMFFSICLDIFFVEIIIAKLL